MECHTICTRLCGQTANLDVFNTNTCSVFLHIYKHHETPSQPSNQKHGDVHAVYEEVVEDAKVQPAVTQKHENDRQFVLETEENPHADVLQTEENRQCCPEKGSEKAAAEIKEEADETIHPSRIQVEVKVVVLGAYELGGARRPTGGVHAGGVRAMEGTNPPWNWDDGHRWAWQSPRFRKARSQDSSSNCRAACCITGACAV